MKKTIQIIVLILLSYTSRSQDLRSAYLQYKWVSDTTYNFELKLYTEASQNMPRPTAPINFGDANYGSMILTGSTTVNGVSFRTYTASHTYNGPGIYNPAYQDSFRIGNIKNIVNSQTQNIRSEASISIAQFAGQNTAPFMLNHPVYFQLNGGNICFDPNFYDVDGDSLSCFLANCCTVGYYIPNGTTLSYNGTLCFSKDSIGLYSFSYLVREWRKDINNNYFIVGHTQVDFVMNITNDVGIQELGVKSSALGVYPNPVSNILNTNSEKNSEIEIQNVFGQTVIKTFYSRSIDVSVLPAGTYFLRAGSSYSKFIKE